MNLPTKEECLKMWEEKILFYADTRKEEVEDGR